MIIKDLFVPCSYSYKARIPVTITPNPTVSSATI